MVTFYEFSDEESEDGKTVFAIGNIASSETKCSVFEAAAETGIPIVRHEVADVPKNEPYIFIKEYKKQYENNMLIAYDGEFELSEINGEEEQ